MRPFLTPIYLTPTLDLTPDLSLFITHLPIRLLIKDFALDSQSHLEKHKIAFYLSNSGLNQVILASYFRTTVRNGYNTVLLDKIYVNLRILTYIKKWDVPCLVDSRFEQEMANAKEGHLIVPSFNSKQDYQPHLKPQQ